MKQTLRRSCLEGCVDGSGGSTTIVRRITRNRETSTGKSGRGEETKSQTGTCLDKIQPANKTGTTPYMTALCEIQCCSCRKRVADQDVGHVCHDSDCFDSDVFATVCFGVVVGSRRQHCPSNKRHEAECPNRLAERHTLTGPLATMYDPLYGTTAGVREECPRAGSVRREDRRLSEAMWCRSTVERVLLPPRQWTCLPWTPRQWRCLPWNPRQWTCILWPSRQWRCILWLARQKTCVLWCPPGEQSSGLTDQTCHVGCLSPPADLSMLPRVRSVIAGGVTTGRYAHQHYRRLWR